MINLDEKIVSERFLNLLNDGKINFLKGDPDLKKLINKKTTHLISSQDLHTKIKTAMDLWKSLLGKALSYIDADTYGYEELYNYFDKYVEFEELIFATDPFYRDHVLHSLWVYYLIEFFYSSNDFHPFLSAKNSKRPKRNASRIKQALEAIRDQENHTKFDTSIQTLDDFLKRKRYESAIRCVCALTHDLGYPLKRISKINLCIDKIKPYFSSDQVTQSIAIMPSNSNAYTNAFLNAISYTYELTHFTENITDEKIRDTNEIIYNLINSKIDKKSGKHSECISKLSKTDLQMLTDNIDIRSNCDFDEYFHLRYSSDYERQEHGIISAFVLVNILRSFKNISIKDIRRYTPYRRNQLKDPNQQIAKLTILQAISNHTSCDNKVSSLLTISDVLQVVDEFEEFSRISRVDQFRQFATEFCKTSIGIEDINGESYFHIKFTFDSKKLTNLDSKLFFKDKCKKFIKIFNQKNIDKDIKIKMSCVDSKEKKSDIYIFTLDKHDITITQNGVKKKRKKFLGLKHI